MPPIRWLTLCLAVLALAGCGAEDGIYSPPWQAGTTLNVDLKSHLQDIATSMPTAGSEGFAKPTSTQLTDWGAVIDPLVNHDYEAADSAIASGLSGYSLIAINDSGNNDKLYYLLQESSGTSLGWGLVVVNPQPSRTLVIEVPHPLYDSNTLAEGVDILRQSGAQFLLVAGTHRCANSATSSCDGTTTACGASGPYRVSDVAHSVDIPFQRLHRLIQSTYTGSTALSLHGFSSASHPGCGDIFLSSGSAATTAQSVDDLQANFPATSSLTVYKVGDAAASCTLTGTTNVQGRYSNGVDSPCNTATSTLSGRFIHIEQSGAVRSDATAIQELIDSINATF